MYFRNKVQSNADDIVDVILCALDICLSKQSCMFINCNVSKRKSSTQHAQYNFAGYVQFIREQLLPTCVSRLVHIDAPISPITVASALTL